MTKHKIQRAFGIALRHHQPGRLREAEQGYRRVLDKKPNHVDALHNLGASAIQTGRNDMAEELFGHTT